jgi:hypothetical protein
MGRVLLPAPAAKGAERFRARLIGSVSGMHQCTFTTISRAADGEFVFGEEAPGEYGWCWVEFIRAVNGGSDKRVVQKQRLQCRFYKAALEAAGMENIGFGSIIFMTPTQSRRGFVGSGHVQRAGERRFENPIECDSGIQTGASMKEMERAINEARRQIDKIDSVFEKNKAIARMRDAINKIRKEIIFKPIAGVAPVDRLDDLSDEELLTYLGRLRANGFNTRKDAVHATIQPFEGGAEYTGDDLAGGQVTNKALTNEESCIGVVPSRKMLEEVEQSVKRNGELHRRLEGLASGNYRPMIDGVTRAAIPGLIGAQAINGFLTLAVYQALAGAGGEAFVYVGRPVADLVWRRLEDHAYNAARRQNTGEHRKRVLVDPDDIEADTISRVLR